MSMESTPLAVTMETATCSWRESTCTTMKLLVIIGMFFAQSTLLCILWQTECTRSRQMTKKCFLHSFKCHLLETTHYVVPHGSCMLAMTKHAIISPLLRQKSTSICSLLSQMLECSLMIQL